MGTYRVGSNVDSWCTKCKLILAHTIEAIASGVIKRVQCNTCKGKHQFKDTKPGESSKKSSPRLKSEKAPRTRSKAQDFTKLLQSRSVDMAVAYNIRTQFARGDVINHSQFGFGVVVEQKDVQKIEVLFESGPKILVHARG